jgi:hypothetical protein
VTRPEGTAEETDKIFRRNSGTSLKGNICGWGLELATPYCTEMKCILALPPLHLSFMARLLIKHMEI